MWDRKGLFTLCLSKAIFCASSKTLDWNTVRHGSIYSLLYWNCTKNLCEWMGWDWKDELVTSKELHSKVDINKESGFLNVLDAIQWYIFLGPCAALCTKTFLGCWRGGRGHCRAICSKFSTICSQEMERATSLTFRVFLPVAAGWSELCLQMLHLTPAPAASLREPEPRETWCCVSFEYHGTSYMMIEMVTQTVYAQWVKMQKETKQYWFTCAGSGWSFPLV